jgi:hemerythrin
MRTAAITVEGGDGSMAFEWTPDLSVGVDEIDKQHKELFKRINGLIVASSEGKGKQEIGSVVKFLESYVVFHFSAEEKYMAQQGYPGLAAHKQIHVRFLKDFSALKEEFQAKGASTPVLLRMHSWLGEWLRDHIGKMDKAVGMFVKTNTKAKV